MVHDVPNAGDAKDGITTDSKKFIFHSVPLWPFSVTLCNRFFFLIIFTLHGLQALFQGPGLLRGLVG